MCTMRVIFLGDLLNTLNSIFNIQYWFLLRLTIGARFAYALCAGHVLIGYSRKSRLQTLVCSFCRIDFTRSLGKTGIVLLLRSHRL